MSKKKAARHEFQVPMPDQYPPVLDKGSLPIIGYCKQWPDGSRSVFIKRAILSEKASDFSRWMLAASAWQADAPKKGGR